MLTYFKNLLTDEDKFIGLARGAMIAFALAIQDGAVPLPGELAWIAGLAAGFIRSSTKTASQE